MGKTLFLKIVRKPISANTASVNTCRNCCPITGRRLWWLMAAVPLNGPDIYDEIMAILTEAGKDVVEFSGIMANHLC